MDRDTAREFVIESLSGGDTQLFAPLRRGGIDLAVRVGAGEYAELLVAEAVSPSSFRADVRRQRPNLFVIGVLGSGESPEAWVVPSGAFERFADADVLQLDAPSDEPLRERLAVYRNRWALITDYAKYRSTLTDPVALQVQLALG